MFVCIAPFNFPLALAAGMSSAALVTGNTVVFKPAQDTPWTGLRLYHIYREAGVPADVLHFVSGRGSVIGDALWQHPKVDGVVFTGSKEVGLKMFRGFSTSWVKPCLMELGGKNACIVTETADIDAAAEGVDEIRLQSPEPEVQRLLEGVRAREGRRRVHGKAHREDPGDPYRRPDGARRVLRPGDQPERRQDLRARGGDGTEGRIRCSWAASA